jgi:hypothetical protein
MELELELEQQQQPPQQHMPQLQRLDLSLSELGTEGFRAMQPGLRLNRTLKELVLFSCFQGDECLHLLADALVGNSIMEGLHISHNDDITSECLDDITRMVESIPRLRRLDLSACDDVLDEDSDDNEGIFDNEDSVQRFAAKLHKNVSVQELLADWHGIHGQDISSTANTICARNKCLAHADLLLLPPLPLPLPPPPLPQEQQQRQRPGNYRGSTLMWMKTCHKAIANFATVPNKAGASAIFKLLQARPALWQKRLKPPPTAAVAAVAAAVTANPHSSLPPSKRKSCLKTSAAQEQAAKKMRHSR